MKRETFLLAPGPKGGRPPRQQAVEKPKKNGRGKRFREQKLSGGFVLSKASFPTSAVKAVLRLGRASAGFAHSYEKRAQPPKPV